MYLGSVLPTSNRNGMRDDNEDPKFGQVVHRPEFCSSAGYWGTYEYKGESLFVHLLI